TCCPAWGGACRRALGIISIYSARSPGSCCCRPPASRGYCVEAETLVCRGGRAALWMSRDDWIRPQRKRGDMLAQLGRAAMVPLWTAQLVTGSKSFERNPVIGSRWLNERGLHAARVRLAHRVAAMRRRRLAGLVAAADRHAFERDGFVVRPNFLPAGEFAELLRQVKAYRGPLREIAEGDTIMRKIALDPKALTALPALRGVLRSP